MTTRKATAKTKSNGNGKSKKQRQRQRQRQRQKQKQIPFGNDRKKGNGKSNDYGGCLWLKGYFLYVRSLRFLLLR
jgi:hypothetical protein